MNGTAGSPPASPPRPRPGAITWLGVLPHFTPFGARWQDEVYGMGAIALVASDCIVSQITVLPRHGPDRSDELVANGSQRVVQLAEGEVVKEVAVRRNDRSEVRALQLVTNLRVHPWAGSAHGREQRVVAPRGWHFSQLVAMPRSDLEELQDADSGACHLGCRLDRVEALREPGALARSDKVRTSAEVRLRDPDAEHGELFFRAHRQLHALVLTCGQGVEDVVVFSRQQFDRFLPLRERQLMPNEHALVLADGERLVGVEVACSRGTCALRFRTSRCTTCWFGRAVSRKLDKLSAFAAGDGEAVCGFFGSRTADGKLCSLGAVFAKPTGGSDDEPLDECM